MRTTVVTALYDIGRKNFDGRSMEQYYDWFSNLLLINCPMVIYCESSLNSFIEEKRPSNLQTKIINQRLEEVPYFYLKDKIESVIQSENYKLKMRDPERIECKNSLYSILQYSKYPWTERAVIENHFESDYFFWIDAGISRLVPDLDFTKKFPGVNFSNQVSSSPGNPIYQMYIRPYPDLLACPVSTDYFWDNRSFVSGGIFAGDRQAILAVKAWVHDVLVNMMLKKDVLNNEQLAIGYLIKKMPRSFLILQNDASVHRTLEILYQSFS